MKHILIFNKSVNAAKFVEFLECLKSILLEAKHQDVIKKCLKSMNDKNSEEQRFENLIVAVAKHVQLPVMQVDVSKLAHSANRRISIEHTHDSKNFTCSTDMLTVDLGDYIKGLSSNQSLKSHIILLNQAKTCQYQFTDTDANIFPGKIGSVEPDKPLRLWFASPFSNLHVGEHRKRLTLTLTAEGFVHSVEVTLHQSVEDFDPDKVLVNMEKDRNREGCYVLDFGKISTTRSYEKCFTMSNFLNLPLRLKFIALDSVIRFEHR